MAVGPNIFGDHVCIFSSTTVGYDVWAELLRFCEEIARARAAEGRGKEASLSQGRSQGCAE